MGEQAPSRSGFPLPGNYIPGIFDDGNDEKSNEKLDEFVSNYNSDDKKFFNKITFKSFVNKIFVVYFG